MAFKSCQDLQSSWAWLCTAAPGVKLQQLFLGKFPRLHRYVSHLFIITLSTLKSASPPQYCKWFIHNAGTCIPILPLISPTPGAAGGALLQCFHHHAPALPAGDLPVRCSDAAVHHVTAPYQYRHHQPLASQFTVPRGSDSLALDQ